MKRIVLFALLGPPLGLIMAVCVLMPLFNRVLGEGSAAPDWHVVVLLPLAYAMGAIPAILVGALDGALAARGIRFRIFLTAIIAYGASFIPLLPVLGRIHDPLILLYGLIGLVPGAVCAWAAGPARTPASSQAGSVGGRQAPDGLGT